MGLKIISEHCSFYSCLPWGNTGDYFSCLTSCPMHAMGKCKIANILDMASHRVQVTWSEIWDSGGILGMLYTIQTTLLVWKHTTDLLPKIQAYSYIRSPV